MLVSMMTQYAGFTVTPLLGAFISEMRGPGETEWGMLSSSAFTIPAYVLLALALVGIALLQFAFTNALPKATLPTAPQTPTPRRTSHVEMSSAAAYNISPIASSVGSVDTESSLSPTNAEAARLQREDALLLLASPGHNSSSSSSNSNGEISSSSTSSKVKGHGERPLLIALLLLNVLIKGGMSCHETLGTQVSLVIHLLLLVTRILLVLLVVMLATALYTAAAITCS
jgi:hypothetical protein